MIMTTTITIIITIIIIIIIYIITIIITIIISFVTPSPPTKSFPTKSPWVKLSGRPPIKFYGHRNSHPLESRVCLSQTLWNPNSY